MQPNYLPDLESLRCFEAAARHLSFRSAAREVSLSPPAFSDRIQRLEESLSRTLFVRTTRRVALTDDGSRLLPHARTLLGEARALVVAMAGTNAPPIELTIGTRFELGISWLTPILDGLAARAPTRTIHLTFGDSPDLLEKTLKGAIDATVTSARLGNARVSYALLHEERYALVAAPKLVERLPLRRADDARMHTLIDAGEGLPLFRYLRDASPADEPWTFASVEILGAIAAIRLRVLAGAGIAVLPLYLVEPDLARGALVRLLPRRPLESDHFRLVWREGHPKEAELHALAADLRTFPLT